MKCIVKKLLKTTTVKTFLILIFVCSTVFAQKTRYITTQIKYKDKDYTVIENQIGLKIKENLYTDDLHKKLEAFNYKITFAAKEYRSIIVQTDGKSDLLEHYLKLEKEDYVEAVFPVEPVKLFYSPNDTRYLSGDQYALDKLNMSKAWEYTKGDPNLIIAVLDSGIPIDANGNLSHTDLSNNSRIKLGKNYVDSLNNVDDDVWHGTHVAGIIGAETNNNIGIAGICFNSKLYISKVGDEIQFADMPKIFNAVKDAISYGCKIINMSLGGHEDNNNTFQKIVAHADSNNVLIVAAVGNYGNSNIAAPAKYAATYSNVIAVSATDSNDNFVTNFSPYTPGSCYGPEVTVSAPGHPILSTIPNKFVSSGYEYKSGTSMSAPMVAGVAGLVWSKFPHLTAAQVRKQIELSSDYLGDTMYFGAGRVNAYNAVKNLYVPQIYPTIQAALNYATAGQTIVVSSSTHLLSSVTIPVGVKLETNGVTFNFVSGGGITINGTAHFTNTTFTSPSWWNGILINSTGEVEFTNSFLSNYVYNTINSGNVKVEGTTFSYAEEGLNFLNSSTGSIKTSTFSNNANDIYGGTTAYINAGTLSAIGSNNFGGASKKLYSLYSGTIPAQVNYWGGSAPLLNTHVTQNVDYTGWMNTPFNNRQGEIDDHKIEIDGIFLKHVIVKNDEPVAEKVLGIEELDEAAKLLDDEKYDEALVAMHRLVDEYKDGFVGKRALVFIEEILKKTERRGEILSMLNTYSVGKSKVAEFAEYRKAYQYLRSNEIDQAIAIIKATEFGEEETDLREARLADLGIIYHDFLDKKSEAYIYFNELVKTYPESRLTKAIQIFYNVTSDGYENPPTAKEEITVTETKLFANYPNPFNPSTAIKYQLSEASPVSLKVYDVMGREVRTLVNSFQDKGSYDVTFNANGLASGIYFYKLNANGQQLINKMLLMK